MLIKYTLQSLLRRSDFTRRIAKWETRLGTFDIRYKQRNCIKGQVLADFVAKFTPTPGITIGVWQVLVQPWRVFVDGASNIMGSGVEIVTPEGLRLEKSLRLCFQASNNEAEYKAFITGLRVAQKLGAEEVEIFSNLRLVVSQVEGSFKEKDPRMSWYLKLFETLQACF